MFQHHVVICLPHGVVINDPLLPRFEMVAHVAVFEVRKSGAHRHRFRFSLLRWLINRRAYEMRIDVSVLVVVVTEKDLAELVAQVSIHGYASHHGGESPPAYELEFVIAATELERIFSATKNLSIRKPTNCI